MSVVGVIASEPTFYQCPACGSLPENFKVRPFRYCVATTEMEPELAHCIPSEFEGLLKQHVRRFHNVGGSVFKFNNEQKEVYRGADLAESPDALKELVQERKVELIINLHCPGRFDLTSWISKESEMFYQFGGEKYITVSDFNYKFSNESEKQQIFLKITAIIQLIISNKGNVFIHCGGGEHRTGIIYAILQKCYQDIPLDMIIQDYKCHSAWKSVLSPGGFNEKNVELIRDFPVELVKK